MAYRTCARHYVAATVTLLNLMAAYLVTHTQGIPARDAYQPTEDRKMLVSYNATAHDVAILIAYTEDMSGEAIERFYRELRTDYRTTLPNGVTVAYNFTDPIHPWTVYPARGR
jgi:hypothetical protein